MNTPSIQSELGTKSQPGAIRLPVIECRHWSAHENADVGVCAIEAFKHPSAGVCLRICGKYDGPSRATSAAHTVAVDPANRVANDAHAAMTPAKIVSFARAALTGSYVDQEIVTERIAACSTCEFRRLDREDRLSCGICGCGLLADARRITNLAAYEENLPSWGCKHPQRARGRGWRR